jgi:hypothetical protein
VNTLLLVAPELLTALVALVGVLVTALLGYRQWRVQQRRFRDESFRTDQQDAYKVLWERVEAVHVSLRIDDLSDAQFSESLTGVNTYLLQKGLYILPADANLVNEYLGAVRRFATLMKSSGDRTERTQWAETAPIPPGVVERVTALTTANAEGPESAR